MKSFSVKGNKLFYLNVGQQSRDAPCYLWAHGWGQNHKAFLKLLRPFENRARHIMIDFPGFGQSPEPPAGWGTEQYADMVADFIRHHHFGSVVWIGHSFGCRVGLQMASKYPEMIAAQIYIGGAGLKVKKSLIKKGYLRIRIFLFKALKTFIPWGLSAEWLHGVFGSSDYKNTSGIMRQVFVKVVNEDLIEEAKMVRCPTLLIYGENDNQTPPSLGKKLHQLIEKSQFIELSKQDHYSVLDSGAHQVAYHLNRFIQGLGFDTK